MLMGKRRMKVGRERKECEVLEEAEGKKETGHRDYKAFEILH